MISDIEMLNSSKLSLARSMAALHGLGDVDPRLAAVQQLSTVLDDARAAMNTAQAMVNDTPYATLNRAQLMGIWNANIEKVRSIYIPRLMASRDEAALDPIKRVGWLSTARDIVSELQFVAKESRQYSFWDAASASLEDALKTMMSHIVKAAEATVGIAGRAIVWPVVQSPVFWLAGAIGLLWIFKEPLIHFAVGKVDKRLNP